MRAILMHVMRGIIVRMRSLSHCFTNLWQWTFFIMSLQINLQWLFLSCPYGYKQTFGEKNFKIRFWVNPSNKMFVCLFVCLSVCLFVPKDFANHWTDRVLLNRVASREGFYLFFGEGIIPWEITKSKFLKLFSLLFRDLNAT